MTTNELNRYDSLPYAISLLPEEDGSFVAIHPDLPGCVAHGRTAAEAVLELNKSRRMWLESNLERGITIPEPKTEDDYSGKIALRTTPHIHAELVARAKESGVSLNHYISTALAGHLGAAKTIGMAPIVFAGVMERMTKAVEALERQSTVYFPAFEAGRTERPENK